MKPILIFITCASTEEAQKISNQLLEQHLIACASILPAVQSHFHWQGKIHHENEFLVILKTMDCHFQQISKIVTELHSYEVPEIISIPIQDGLPAYLKWLVTETHQPERH